MDQDSRREEWMIFAVLFVLLIIAGTIYYFRENLNEYFLVTIKYSLFPVQYIPDYIINTLFFWKTPLFSDFIIGPLHDLTYDFVPYKYANFLIDATTPQLIAFNYPTGSVCQDISPNLNIFSHYYVENMGVACSDLSNNYLMSPHAQLFSINAFLADAGPANQYGGLLRDLGKSNAIANYVGGLIWPYFFSIYAYIIFTYRKKRKYEEVHTADTILEQERTVWHTIEPMLNVHPELEKDLEAGPWAMAKRAEHYGIDQKMIIKLKNGFSLDFNRSESVFSKQCGREFRGIPSFTIHERWLYAMFLTKANRNGKTANVMLDLLNDVHTSRTVSKSVIKVATKKLNTLVDEMLDKYADSDIEKMVFAEHYYTVCIMSRMLDEARQDGVLATSNFVWLRPLDRHLWYMMSNTGRGGIKKESGSASFIEVAGPTCHMISERLLKKKIAIPDVRQAIIAFDQYWFETNDKYTQHFKDEY